MTHFIAKTVLITGVSVALTGCAQLGSFSNDLWGHTKYAVNYVTKPVASLLRSAPEQDYVFEGVTDDQGGQLSENQPSENMNPEVTQSVEVTPLPEVTPSAGLNNLQIPDDNRAYEPPLAPEYVPVQSAEAAPITPQAQPRETGDISFVKIGGGSNMNDWLSCETKAGGFIRVTQSGYLVDPGFESCMRAKGYKPESEVEDLIASGLDIPS